VSDREQVRRQEEGFVNEVVGAREPEHRAKVRFEAALDADL
jgi:hypothetical protein